MRPPEPRPAFRGRELSHKSVFQVKGKVLLRRTAAAAVEAVKHCARSAAVPFRRSWQRTSLFGSVRSFIRPLLCSALLLCNVRDTDTVCVSVTPSDPTSAAAEKRTIRLIGLHWSIGEEEREREGNSDINDVFVTVGK